MTLLFEQEYDMDLGIDYEAVADKVINAALDYEKCPYEVEVDLTLVDNATIKEINRDYREIDNPTDVLSFPLVDYEKPADFEPVYDMDDCFNPETGELMLGDIFISLDKVKEQAEAYGHGVLREYAFLIAHSMLHLMGYDHMEPEEAADMEARQSAILEGLGYVR